ncbi:GyrI-like domain-containing protein [bacterium]|nr:GyrI-like domain-containing protein [candidate division CSSED10-310 bacterium]
MTGKDILIAKKKTQSALVASRLLNIQNRLELQHAIDNLKKSLPADAIAGPPFCTFNFITSYPSGFDVEIGFPVNQSVTSDSDVNTRLLPGVTVLSLVHSGPHQELRESYKRLYGYASERGIISDEFNREIYLDDLQSEIPIIELQFVVHEWDELLARHIERVKGTEVLHWVMMGDEPNAGNDDVSSDGMPDVNRDAIDAVATLMRFKKLRLIIDRLSGVTSKFECFDILSRCAHNFPDSQIDKLRSVYQAEMARYGDPLGAVDAVISFMGHDPGWKDQPRREGHVIYSSKQPRDPDTYNRATSVKEKARACCFCPLIRDHLDAGMPVDFCYCGAGWYRKQWEGAINRPVRVDVIHSLLKGDDHCSFAIHLPEDL